jgi:hypothetical protein
LTVVINLSPSQHIPKDHTITNSTFHTGILRIYFKNLHFPYSQLKIQNHRGLTLLLADVRFVNNWYWVSLQVVKQMGLGADHPSLLVPWLSMHADIPLHLCTLTMLWDDVDLNCQCYNNITVTKTHFDFGRIMVKDYSHALLILFVPEPYQRQWQFVTTHTQHTNLSLAPFLFPVRCMKYTSPQCYKELQLKYIQSELYSVFCSIIDLVVPQGITLLSNHTNTISFLQSYPL